MLKPMSAWKVQQIGLQRSLLGIKYPPAMAPGRQRRGRNRQDERATAVSDPPLINENLLTAPVREMRYYAKSSTDFVAIWLVNTARARGYRVDLLETNTNDDGDGNGISNNRVLEPSERPIDRDIGETSTISTPKNPAPHTVHTKKIRINKFVKLAHFLANASDPPVRIPKKFVKALNTAIATRRNHTAQILSHMPYSAELRRVTQRHFHFASILERVRKILEPRMPEVKMPKERTDDTMNISGNKLDAFDAQEPSGWFLQAPDITISSGGADLTFEVNYEADLRLNMEEAYLGFDRLMQDFRSLRRAILRAWDGYHLGTFDLVTVSLMTNSAISIARKLQEDVQKLFDKHGGSSKMLGAFYAASCAVYGEDPAFREQPGDDLNFQVYDIADSMMLPTQMLLQSLGTLVEPGNILPCEPGYYGTFDPASDRSKKSARERFQDDRIVLQEILSNFLAFHRAVPYQPFEDELTRGLRLMFDTQDIPIWLVFAAHVFLDTHHALRGNVAKGFSDLKTSVGPIEASIKANLEIHSSLSIAEWPKGYGTFFATVQDINTWLDSDPVEEQKARLQVRPWEMFKFMKGNPLFCGMFNYSLMGAYQELSLSFSAACIQQTCTRLSNPVRFKIHEHQYQLV